MPLTAGTRLGPYEITGVIGAGGMGQVYRARDTRLQRDVAIKVLPDLFATDPDRLARFEREARTLASLNHPNIAQIYGLEESPSAPSTRSGQAGSGQASGVLALAMELVEGEDLAVRLSRGPVPLREALAIARQIVEALEAAHEHGIIHRDLKPANIRVRSDGTVKVLDFGLAKAFEAVPTAADALANSPTLTNTGTELGVILGTAAYMAPEQAMGRAVDRRADIWGFGVVLYELLSGGRLFGGATSTEILARVLEREPDWSRLPGTTPDGVLRLLRRCLTKDPRQRLQAIGDARLEIDDTLSAGPERVAPGVSPRWRERVWAAVAASALVAALVLSVIVSRSPSRAPAQVPIRSAISLPPGQFLDGFGAPELALSNDGRTLAFVARGTTGVQHLYVRSLDSESATLVPGSDTVEGPFFSPDGRWVGFAVGVSITGGGIPPELRKYSLETGLTQTICRIDDYFGGVWAADNSIVYAGAQPNGLRKVAAGGGPPESIVKTFIVDGKDVPRAVYWPDLLPGGQSILVSDTETGMLAVVDRQSRRLTSLGLSGSGGRVLPGGYLVYAGPNAALMAVGFDVSTLGVTGTPVALLPDIALARNNSPAFAFSASGLFVYATGYLRGSRREPMRLVRATPTGQTTVLPFEPALFRRGFTLSPDGTTLAADTWDESARWLFDLERHTRTRLPREGIRESHTLAWTRDGRVITLAGLPVDSSLWGVFNQKADGSGGLETILAPVPMEVHLAGWTEDGQALALWGGEPNNVEMLLMRLDRGQPVRTIRKELGAIYSAKISPDGRWLAFDSTATSQAQIYVVSFSDGATRVAVSSGGGVYPVWSRDGKALFFRRDRSMIAVDIMAGTDGIRFGPERKLFDWDIGREFVVGPRGDFVGFEPVPGAALQTSIQLRTNWFDEVRRVVGRQP